MVFFEVVTFFVRLFVAMMVLHRIAAAARLNFTVEDEFSGSGSGLGPSSPWNESTPPSTGVAGSPVSDGDNGSTTVEVALSVTGALAGIAGVVVAALCVRHMLKRHRDNEQAEQIQMDELESVSVVRDSKRTLSTEVNCVLTVVVPLSAKVFRELQWIRAKQTEHCSVYQRSILAHARPHMLGSCMPRVINISPCPIPVVALFHV